MNYQTDPATGNRVMSDVWKCPLCSYQTNVIEDRRNHLSKHRAGDVLRAHITRAIKRGENPIIEKVV